MSSKRSLSVASRGSPDETAKRLKLNPKRSEEVIEEIPIDVSFRVEDEVTAVQSLAPSHHANARVGIQRSIAMVLKHDGFNSSTPEAMESFTGIVETCSLRHSSKLPGSYPSTNASS